MVALKLNIRVCNHRLKQPIFLLRKLEGPQPLHKIFIEKEKRVIYNAKLIYWEKLGGGRTASRYKEGNKENKAKAGGLKSFLAVGSIVQTELKMSSLKKDHSCYFNKDSSTILYAHLISIEDEFISGQPKLSNTWECLPPWRIESWSNLWRQ